MKGDKPIVGMIIILTMVLMGGTIGMATSYYLMSSAADIEAEAERFKTLEQEFEQVTEELEEAKEPENHKNITVEQKQPPVMIQTEQMEELEQALDVWKKVMFQTAKGELSHEEAGKLMYSLSGEVYKRNLSEEFATHWLRSVMKHRKDKENLLQEIHFAEPINDQNGMTLVQATEVYTKNTSSYQLKLKKEDGQWRFITQIMQ